MSTIAESLRRQRLPLLTIAAVVALGAAAWVLVSRTTSQHLTQPEVSVAAPEIEQAKWKIDSVAAARPGKLTKAQHARFVSRSKSATALVTGLYDGIFLERARLQDIIKDSFSLDASKSFRADRLGFPSGATDVTTLSRKAEIAVDASTAATAIAQVSVVAEATLGERSEEIRHRSTLWIDRGNDGWRVIAFDVKQGPSK